MAAPASLLFLMTLALRFFPSDLAVTSFIFGDSLVDAGNNDHLFTLSKADAPPYGIDFAASGGQPTGRFTNGRTIADIIGEKLGAKSFPPPYLAPHAGEDLYLQGANYASGASGILDETGSLFIERLSLRRQVEYFKQTRDDMEEMLGANTTEAVLKKALFSLTSGSNDLLNYLQPSLPTSQTTKLPPSILLDLMVSNLTRHVQRLYELGGRKFVVVGVGPLGCIPYVRSFSLDPPDQDRCSASTNKLIQEYNSKVVTMVEQMNREMGPEAVFVYANSFDVFMDIIQSYQTYGFENAEDACCGGNFPPLMCYRGGQVVKISSSLCEDRSKYVFWDAYHPTEAVNVIIAENLLDGDQSVSFPINVRELYERGS